MSHRLILDEDDAYNFVAETDSETSTVEVANSANNDSDNNDSDNNDSDNNDSDNNASDSNDSNNSEDFFIDDPDTAAPFDIVDVSDRDDNDDVIIDGVAMGDAPVIAIDDQVQGDDGLIRIDDQAAIDAVRHANRPMPYPDDVITVNVQVGAAANRNRPVDLTAGDAPNEAIHIDDRPVRTPPRTPAGVITLDTPQIAAVNSTSVINLDTPQAAIHNNSVINLDTPQTAASNASFINLDTPQTGVNSSVITLDTPQTDNVPAMQSAGPSKPRSHTPKKSLVKMDMQSPGSVSDDDPDCCMICFELYEASGAHRMASLKCGHLFGQNCIERWLSAAGCHKCPKCNAKATKKDIRVIYAAKSLKMVDTTERDQALGDLVKERKRRQDAEMESAQLRLNVQTAHDELKRLREEVQRQQAMMDVLRHSSSATSLASIASSQSSQDSFMTSSSQIAMDVSSNSRHKFEVLRPPINMGETAKCRVMAYCQAKSTLCVSQQSANPLFPGYGIKKLNGALDFRVTEYVKLHSHPIRDLAFKPNERVPYILTASMDKTLNLTSLDSNRTVVSYKLDLPVWSCAFDHENTNYMYAGQLQGKVAVFDIRNTSHSVETLTVSGPPLPVHTLYNISSQGGTGQDRMSGLLLGQLNGVVFFEKKSDSFKPHVLLKDDGAISSLALHPHSLTTLVSLRPSSSSQGGRVRHQLMRMHMQQQMPRGAMGVTWQNNNNSTCTMASVHVYQGGNTQKVLPRNRLLPHPSQDGNLLVCASDEASSSVMIWEATSGSMFQKLAVRDGPVMDMCHIHEQEMYRLCALTEKQLLIYNWK